jgi:hypothetical protein
MSQFPMIRAGFAALALVAFPVLASKPVTLAVDPAGAARLKSGEAFADALVPPPELSTLTGTLTADGRVELKCSGSVNPSYLRYRERIEQAAREGVR